MNTDAFKGKGLWVWYLPDDPADLADEVRAGAYNWVAVKVHDGGSSWCNRGTLQTPWGRPAPSPDARYVLRLRESGASVLGWGYVYCDGRTDLSDRGDGVPELEAAAATNAVRELRLDGYVADMEQEVEGRAAEVGRFFDALDAGWDGTVGGEVKRARDYPLAVACWAAVDGHREYPWQAVVQRTDCLMPMVYRDEWSADTVAPVVALAANAGKPVAPVVSIFSTSSGATELDVQRMAGWALGVSAWEWSGVRAAPWWRQWRMPQGVPVSPPNVPLQPPPDPGKMAAWRDRLWPLIGDAANEGLPEARALHTLIRWGKGEIDLSQEARRELGL